MVPQHSDSNQIFVDHSTPYHSRTKAIPFFLLQLIRALITEDVQYRISTLPLFCCINFVDLFVRLILSYYEKGCLQQARLCLLYGQL